MNRQNVEDSVGVIGLGVLLFVVVCGAVVGAAMVLAWFAVSVMGWWAIP